MSWSERYVSVAGAGAHDGTSEANAWTFAEAIAAVAAGNRVNMKAGTYANTTTERNLAINGTTTAPIWWRGYASTIGDLDDVADGAASGPQITFTTARFLVTGNHQILSSLSISGAQVTNGQLRTATGGYLLLYRCRVECTSANSAGVAVLIGHDSVNLVCCYFKANASATAVVVNETQTVVGVLGCAFEGGGHGLSFTVATTAVIVGNTFNNNGGDAIRMSAAGRMFALFNSIYSPGSDGIELLTTVANGGIVAGNIFSECAAYGITNSTAAATDNIVRLFNLFHSNTSGNENGFGDSPSLAAQTDSASPYTSAATGDLSLLSTSNAKANGPPKKYENQSYVSYLDVGAVQRQEPTVVFVGAVIHNRGNPY